MLRLCLVGVVLFAISVYTEELVRNDVIDEGSSHTISVLTLGHDVVNCHIDTPNDGTFEFQAGDQSKSTPKFTILNDLAAYACMATINNIDKNDEGDWSIYYTPASGEGRSQLYHITVNLKENALQEEDRSIQYLQDIVIDTDMNTAHKIVIHTDVFSTPESCHLITPNGLQYSLIDGLNVPDVEIINEYEVECGVMIHVASSDMIGEWTLISRTSWIGIPTERRQPFTINVEANYSLINNINIRVGSNLHLRLEESISITDSCKLYGPDGQLYSDYEVDTINIDRCGYIVKDVSEQHNGTWVIQYEDSVINNATFEVMIHEAGPFTPENLVWTLGSSVNVPVGPADAVYCKLEDVKGYIMYDGFGQCRVNLDRVTDYYDGVWTIHIGFPGSIVMRTDWFSVTVRGAEQEPIITTSVSRVAPTVILTCSIPEEHQVRACNFRHPHGNTVIVQQGVSQDGYETEITGQNCILRLTSPTAQDLGLWRCAMETEETTFFAFLTVTCPWLMQDPEVAASVVIEPVLKQQRHEVIALEGEPTMLRCSVPASIRYCYFRAGNGSIYNVAPAISSSDHEYIGSGLHAGDCGISLKQVALSDAGQWSCHVGLMDNTIAEQSAAITLEVQEKISVSHYWNSDNRLVLEAFVHDSHPLDYCRFVRITGQGFTQYNTPEGFSVVVNKGHCILYMENPNILDIHPWTVVAKLTGVEAEISKSSSVIIRPIQNNMMTFLGMIFLWTFCTVLGILMLGAAFALIPKKNREWTYNRASNIRNSLRRNRPAVQPTQEVNAPRSSIFKEPLADPPKYQETA